MMEASSTSETSVKFYQTTRRNNSEDRHLQTRRCENLKSHRTKCRRETNIKTDRKDKVLEIELDSSGSGYSWIVWFFEHGNETLSAVKVGLFLVQRTDYYLPERVTVCLVS
jgi:hypothetical protein